MAKLDRIKIKGFKSIKEADIPLTNLNVLIGANGAGKSNFISFFKMLNAIKNNDEEDYVAKSGGANKLLYFGSKVTKEIEIDLIIKKNNELISHSFNLELIIGDKLKKGRYFILNDTPVQPKDFYGFPLDFYTYHFNDTSNEARIKLTTNINDNEYIKPDGANLSAYLYLIKEKYPEIYTQILKSVQLVAPFIKDFRLRPNPLNPEIIRLEWVHKGQEEYYFDISDLSDGTLRFICLATLLLQPNPPETIIIDEPELGLHPYAISILASLIRKASFDNQIIISTQSVELVDEFKPENMIVVDRKRDEINPELEKSVFRRLTKEELTDWLEDYTLGELWVKNVFDIGDIK